MGDYVVFVIYPCLLSVAVPSARLWPVSTSPKSLFLAKFIVAKFRMNTIVTRLQGEASVPERTVRARGESAGCRSMGLLSVTSV